MLYGRREERALIAGLLADAREARAGVLVIRGEPGVGKSTLLQDAAEQAADMYLLHGTGVDSEVELAFAALYQLLRPVMDRLDRLPTPQAGALRGAFGLDDDTRPNRFLIELATLSLLAEVAEERPLLCLIDDAQWLDRASADALVFVARRLQTERIALLLAARDGDRRQLHTPGLPQLRLGGLDPEAAGQLLEEHAGTIAADVRERLIEKTGGNPLALVELPATLSGEQLAGREPLPERIALSARLQQAFLQRVRKLPEATQTLLLTAAVEDAGELATVLAGGLAMGVGPGALEPAERIGLVHISGQQLRFRHPLVRSAIYHSVSFTARQRAHQALAAVLEGEQHTDRRAWHLAAAATGPDEQVARALESSADRARRRGGPAAAAAALERAAALTLEATPRARRLVAAAEHVWEAGHSERAQALLDRVTPLPADAAVQAGIAHIRGAIELGAGTPAVACTLLVEGARLILESDPRQAAQMLVLATWGALGANQLERIVNEIGPAIPHLAGQDGAHAKQIADSLIRFALRHLAPAPAAEAEPRQPVTSTLASGEDPRLWLWPMPFVAELAGSDVALHQLCARSVAIHRASGTVSTLTLALANLAATEVALGRWRSGTIAATDGLRLARETGQEGTAGYFLTLLSNVAALEGRTADCRRLAGEALACALPRRLALVAASASWSIAALDLAEGRPKAAYDRLLALTVPSHPTAHAVIALLTTGDLVEAAVRADTPGAMEPFVTRFEHWAEWDGRPWTLVRARRCRALVSEGEQAERQFQAALAVDGVGERPYELARTELLYGEWLRRERRRFEARSHLRAALELFERFGAAAWAERARSELRASGETARKRNLSAVFHLTPQELQIARLAAQGLTNREIAAQLFLSPHTVSYHLHKVFSKLGVTSRASLRTLELDRPPELPSLVADGADRPSG
jgi:DNA-binding CsgD family transcriptional regulator